MKIACLGECMLELGQGGGTTRFGFGGDTLNTAAYLARETRGAATVHYVTALGDDPMSAELLDAWRKIGIDTTHVQCREGELPGLYLIRTDTVGERSFYYWRERAAVRALLDDGYDGVLRDALKGHALLYLSGITLAIFEGERRDKLLALLAHLRAAGVSVAFDTNYRARLWPGVDAARDSYARIAQHVDIAMPGLEDERALHGPGSVKSIVGRWRAAGAREVVVRAGEAGAHAQAGDSHATHRPERLDPIDTTAAGDAFNASYLAARLDGAPLDAALGRANALAGRVIMHAGAIVPEAASHPDG